MKKIVIQLITMTPSGGLKVLFYIGNLLHARGYEVEYIVADRETPLPFPSKCKFTFAGKSQNLILRILWLSTVKYSADVVIATLHPTVYSTYFNNSSPAAKKIYYIQAYEPDFYTDSPKTIIRYFHHYLSAVFSYFVPLTQVVNCVGSMKGLPKKNLNKANIIPPGIDTTIYYPHSKNNNIFTIGHIARKEAWKGSFEFFQAMNILRTKGYQFKVKIAYDLCENTCGIEYERIIPKNEDELAQFYSSCDTVVSAVWQKGFGLPPLETMACGSISIATPMDYGIPMHDHIPIEVQSPESIVAAVEYILQNPIEAEKIQNNGLLTAQTYDWSIITDKWVNLIEDL